MNAVIYCLTAQHDLRLVLLAGIVSFLSTGVGYDLLNRARAERRQSWLFGAAFVAGSGIWATHFIAMLAYNPGFAIGFELETTALSALAGMMIGGVGFAILVYAPGHRILVPLAGAIIGGGVAVLHYVGMSAAHVAGMITWDWTLVGWSIAIGCGLGAVSTVLFDRAKTGLQRVGAALLLALAVCAHHFTGMGAILLEQSAAMAPVSGDLSKPWLAAAIAAAMVMILGLATLGGTFDGMLMSQTQREARRYSALANAAVEGIVICRNGAIVDANESFCQLTGRSIDQLRGTPFAATVASSAQYDITTLFAQNASRSVAVDLHTTLGDAVPVDVLRRMSSADDPDVVILAVRDLRERREAESRISYLAHHDALTGLANRTFFALRVEDEMQRADRTGRTLGFHYVDLDRFKEINDTFGHSVGDDVLKEAARRLEGLAKAGTIIARLGGDEFAVIQMDVASGEDVVAFAEEICTVMSAPLAAVGEERPIALSASVGVALYPNDGRDLDSLAHSADVALYRAKEAGRGTFRTFESGMAAELRDRRELQNDLALAIAADEIRVVYQPQVRITDGGLTGFEALARWTHPVRGEIPPALFVALAERNGSILQLGELMLRKSCAEAATWQEPLKVSVNLSPVQITHGNLPELITRILLETGLPGTRLELEVTEGVLIKDMDRALHVLRRVKALGVTIAMDDFGTGYSSLHYLQSFPFDKLKIDRSFVQNLGQNAHSRAIVRAIIGLGRALGLPVVAEGVETQAQLALLDSEACEQVQGYLTGRPQPIEAFAGVLSGVEDALPESQRAAG